MPDSVLGSSKGSSSIGSRLSVSRLLPLVAVLATALAIPASVYAGPLTLRFAGTVDLTAFGGSSTDIFRGSVTWDPDAPWYPVNPCPDFCLDGSPGAVSATFSLNSTDLTAFIDPISRFIVWGWGGISLDLYFAPSLDFDGGAAPDVRLFSLNLFSHPADHALLIDSTLPDDLAFLSRLNRKSAFFFSEWEPDAVTFAEADTLTVVAEPAGTLLLLCGSVGYLVTRRRRGRGNHAHHREPPPTSSA